MTAKVKSAKPSKPLTRAQVEAKIGRDTREEASYKHAERTAKSVSSRKHDAKEVARLGRDITGLKDRLAGKKSKRRGLALSPADVSCCAAQAVASSLRVAGGTVSERDVLALYWRTAADPDAGASILATLEAAERYGLAGARPASVWPDPNLLDALNCENVIRDSRSCWSEDWPAGLLLGLDLPAGPHTVFADKGIWWSWLEPYDPADFAGAVIEEAWAVSWS